VSGPACFLLQGGLYTVPQAPSAALELETRPLHPTSPPPPSHSPAPRPAPPPPGWPRPWASSRAASPAATASIFTTAAARGAPRSWAPRCWRTCTGGHRQGGGGSRGGPARRRGGRGGGGCGAGVGGAAAAGQRARLAARARLHLPAALTRAPTRHLHSRASPAGCLPTRRSSACSAPATRAATAAQASRPRASRSVPRCARSSQRGARDGAAPRAPGGGRRAFRGHRPARRRGAERARARPDETLKHQAALTHPGRPLPRRPTQTQPAAPGAGPGTACARHARAPAHDPAYAPCPRAAWRGTRMPRGCGPAPSRPPAIHPWPPPPTLPLMRVACKRERTPTSPPHAHCPHCLPPPNPPAPSPASLATPILRSRAPPPSAPSHAASVRIECNSRGLRGGRARYRMRSGRRRRRPRLILTAACPRERPFPRSRCNPIALHMAPALS
jgi:hypothetical protein